MVGELDVAIAGRPATLQFVGDHIRLRLQDYRSAWAVRSTPLPDLSGWGRWLAHLGLDLRLQIGEASTVQLFPNPGWLVRLSSPAIRQLARQEPTQ
jgi:hypothetical protein